MFLTSIRQKSPAKIVPGIVDKCSNFHQNRSFQINLVRRQISQFFKWWITFAKTIKVTLKNQITYESRPWGACIRLYCIIDRLIQLSN